MFFKSKINKIFFIAEIGSNHEGNFQKAKKMTYDAIKSGADAIKFQIFNHNTLVNRKKSPERHKHFKRLELKINQFIELAKICKKNNKIFMASVWDQYMLKKINPYLQIHKVGSGDLTNLQILGDLIKTKKPIIISTGLSTFSQIDNVIKFIKKKDISYIKKKKIALLQCTSNYPNPNSEVNLANINIFQKKYGLPVGFSDHTVGSLACEISYVMGAKIIEKHFTYNKKIKTFRDHQISMTKNDVEVFLNKINEIDNIIGTSKKKVLTLEKKSKNYLSFRRAIYAKKNIKKNEKFSEDNLILLRPLLSGALGAENYFQILGKKSKRDIKKNNLIKF